MVLRPCPGSACTCPRHDFSSFITTTAAPPPGYYGTILGRNTHRTDADRRMRGGSLHPAHDRLLSLEERARLQGIPSSM